MVFLSSEQLNPIWSGSLVSWILDSNLQQDSGFLVLDSGFQSPGFRIPQAKNSWIPESGFPYMGPNFRCIYFLVFETAFYIAFFVYTTYCNHRFASHRFFFNVVNVSSLRFNKLCLHPYRREHHYRSESSLSASRIFCPNVGLNDRPVSNVPRSHKYFLQILVLLPGNDRRLPICDQLGRVFKFFDHCME